MRRSRFATLFVFWLLTFVTTQSHAAMVIPATLETLARSSARIFRGHCVKAETGTVEIAGGRIAVTTYTFEVADNLKGVAGGTVSFRQVGSAAGGRRDLGALAGLPVYAPAAEYILFLLPESSVGLTSPAGAEQGAFVIRGERVHAASGASLAPARVQQLGRGLALEAGTFADGGLPYDTFRRAVLEYVQP